MWDQGNRVMVQKNEDSGTFFRDLPDPSVTGECGLRRTEVCGDRRQPDYRTERFAMNLAEHTHEGRA